MVFILFVTPLLIDSRREIKRLEGRLEEKKG